mmetsp:Transcript_4992/g.6781  ORF Transcript_4992/g.6781 Transcript_4992/m.6781 type:complete len:345 (+) Transcript_4992:98-1132(+)
MGMRGLAAFSSLSHQAKLSSHLGLPSGPGSEKGPKTEGLNVTTKEHSEFNEFDSQHSKPEIGDDQSEYEGSVVIHSDIDESGSECELELDRAGDRELWIYEKKRELETREFLVAKGEATVMRKEAELNARNMELAAELAARTTEMSAYDERMMAMQKYLGSVIAERDSLQQQLASLSEKYAKRMSSDQASTVESQNSSDDDNSLACQDISSKDLQNNTMPQVNVSLRRELLSSSFKMLQDNEVLRVSRVDSGSSEGDMVYDLVSKHFPCIDLFSPPKLGQAQSRLTLYGGISAQSHQRSNSKESNLDTIGSRQWYQSTSERKHIGHRRTHTSPCVLMAKDPVGQ